MSFYRHGPNRPGGYGVRLGVPTVTPLVRAIMIACGVVWFVQFLLYRGAGYSLAGWFGVVPLDVVRGFLWQPFTYMFLHSPLGPFHVLFNMLMLWMFGGELERFWGSRAFLRYYVVCGVGAGIAATLFGLSMQGLGQIPVIGASGAIYGLFVAYGMVFAERTILFMLIFPMKARTMAGIMFGMAFIYTISGTGGGISHVSHLGGALVGYLYLKRAWRIGDFYRELKWKIKRRRFKVMPPQQDDVDRWLN